MTQFLQEYEAFLPGGAFFFLPDSPVLHFSAWEMPAPHAPGFFRRIRGLPRLPGTVFLQKNGKRKKISSNPKKKLAKREQIVYLHTCAEVVKLVDTLGSGSSSRSGVRVRVSSSAPAESIKPGRQYVFRAFSFPPSFFSCPALRHNVELNFMRRYVNFGETTLRTFLCLSGEKEACSLYGQNMETLHS